MPSVETKKAAGPRAGAHDPISREDLFVAHAERFLIEVTKPAWFE